MSDPIPVSTGFTWTAAGAWATALLIFGTVITLIIKQVGPWRKQTQDATDKLVDDLSARIAKLEKRLDSQGKRHDAHLEIVKQLHEGEIALLRHRLGGEEQNNIALMTVLKSLDVPARVLEAIDASRAKKQEAIAAEQAEMTRLRATAVEKLAKLAEDVE